MLIDVMCELIMADTISPEDIEDCLDDFMEGNFCVDVETADHKEISETLVTLREELTKRAHESLDMTCGPVLMGLIEFNSKNSGKVDEL